MPSPNKLAFILSTLISVSIALVAYAIRAQPKDEPVWLSSWASQQRSPLAFITLALALTQALFEAWRWYASARHPSKGTLEKLISDFSRTHFKDRDKQNRVTLFRATEGWRVFFYGATKLSMRGHGHKWRALWSVKWNKRYLGVYVRPPNVRNRFSASAFQVSDDAAECEGVAGLVWEEGSVKLLNLPDVGKAEVRAITSLDRIEHANPIRVYCESTNIRRRELVQSLDHFGRNFLGTVIRRSDGTQWGVLLIDSEESECVFAREESDFKPRFDEFARIIGKIVA